MTWGAHKADGRLAAKNSVKIRAALRASIDAEEIFREYQDTHPFVTDNNTQDRARARAWAMLHVKINQEPIKDALIKVWADGYILGDDSAKEAVAKAEKAGKSLTKAKKPTSEAYVDWANWKAGDRAAALILRPTGAFEQLLAKAGITSANIAKVGYDRIGTALADSIAAGFSPKRAAKVIAEKVGDPARALTIAITEQNRAISTATIQRYKESGLEKVEWSGADPCDICAPNEGQVVVVGEPFENGDTEPPSHPNCRCALLPVINEDFYAETGESEPTEEPPAYLSDKELKEIGKEQSKHLGELSPEDYRALNSYKSIDYMKINDYLREGETSLRLGLDPIENQRIIKIWKDRIDRVQKTIEDTPPITKPFITYRGITGEAAEQIWNSEAGSVYQDKGFVSTTSSQKVAKEFGGITQLHVINSTGTQGLAIENIIDMVGHNREHEWLLPAGSKFEIVSKIEASEATDYRRIVTVKVVK